MRTRDVVVSTRTTTAERGLIRVVAEAEGVTVAEVIHRLLMPEVCRRALKPAGSGSRPASGAERE